MAVGNATVNSDFRLHSANDDLFLAIKTTDTLPSF